MERHGVISYKGAGSLLDANTVHVQGSDGTSTTLTATTILLATGTHPHRPADYPWQDTRLFDFDKILNIGELPDSLLVIGGGVIGSEYACIFAALGVRVTLIDGRDRLLGFLDPDVSNIYAAGDVIGFPALASTSMQQARIAMCHAFDLKYKTGLARILPLGIYTIPECSSAGRLRSRFAKKAATMSSEKPPMRAIRVASSSATMKDF
jgi:NAD(P) transhydrogenase